MNRHGLVYLSWFTAGFAFKYFLEQSPATSAKWARYEKKHEKKMI